jgi:hypothetical protein
MIRTFYYQSTCRLLSINKTNSLGISLLEQVRRFVISCPRSFYHHVNT